MSFDYRRAGRELRAVVNRLTTEIGGKPIPPMKKETEKAYRKMADAHDRRDMNAFLPNLARFEAAWVEQIRGMGQIEILDLVV